MITIAMALYKPNLVWLKEQIASFASQTDQNFQVLVWNDCPGDDTDYTFLFNRILGPKIPVKIFHGRENIGSNQTFANLTAKTDTPFIAYSDQDDVWEPDKLEVLLNLLQQNETALAYSDTMIIDKDSNLLYTNARGVRPRQREYATDMLQHLLVKNFITGCTILMDTAIAKEALPFPEEVFHDWWLAIAAASKNGICRAPNPLVRYRIHGDNQSGILNKVNDKGSYYTNYIHQYNHFIYLVQEKYKDNNVISHFVEWGKQRAEYFNHPSIKLAKQLYAMRQWSLETAWFELLLPFIPDILFKKLLAKIKAGKM